MPEVNVKFGDIPGAKTNFLALNLCIFKDESNIVYELQVNDTEVQQCIAMQSLYLERSDPFAAPDDKPH